MSIFGKPQEIYTVKSSWEVLDSPVPLRQTNKSNSTPITPSVSSHGVSTPHNLGVPPHRPSSTTLSPSASPNIQQSTAHQASASPSIVDQIGENRLLVDTVQSATGVGNQPDNLDAIDNSNVSTIELTNSDITIVDVPSVSEHIVDITRQDSDNIEQNSNNTDRGGEVHAAILDTEPEQHQQQPSRQETATYVSTHRRRQDDIADTLVLEFEHYARRSRSSYRRQYLEHTTHHSQYDILPQLSDVSNHTVQTEGSRDDLGNQSTTSQIRDQSHDSWEINQQAELRHQTDTTQGTGLRHQTDTTQETGLRHQAGTSQEPALRHQTGTTIDLVPRDTIEVQTMSQSTNIVYSVTADERNIPTLPDTRGNVSTRQVEYSTSNSSQVNGPPNNSRYGNGSRNNSRQRRRDTISQRSEEQLTNRHQHIDIDNNDGDVNEVDNISPSNHGDQDDTGSNREENHQPLPASRDPTIETTAPTTHSRQHVDVGAMSSPLSESGPNVTASGTRSVTEPGPNGTAGPGTNVTDHGTRSTIELGQSGRSEPGSNGTSRSTRHVVEPRLNLTARGVRPVVESGSNVTARMEEHAANVRTDHGSNVSARRTHPMIESESGTRHMVEHGSNVVIEADTDVRSHINIPPPMIQPGTIYHPPPTIVQNGGISQNDLLDLMSKGLGNFTSEMATILIERIKPEYDIMAKKVGQEVKEATVDELRELRAKLKEAEYKLESISDERDLLKTENIKERDLMKREFEKDRLKRLKDSEEKNELIDKLNAENAKLQAALKDKDKHLKKADFKVKAEEAKRKQCEEEADKRIKEMQKELDKVKGELLMFKSKKRLQVTSAKNRKDSVLSKLNSHHGVTKHFEHLPYHEGDEG